MNTFVKKLLTTITLTLSFSICANITTLAAPEDTVTEDSIEETSADEEINYALEGVEYPFTVVVDGTLQLIDYTITFKQSADTSLYAPDGYKWISAEWTFNTNTYVAGNVIWFWHISADNSQNWIEVDNSFMEPFKVTNTSVSDWNGSWVFNIVDPNNNTLSYTCVAGIQMKEDGRGGIVYAMVPEEYEGSKILVGGSKVENGVVIKNLDNEYTFLFK